jgi:hypothetical protein
MEGYNRSQLVGTNAASALRSLVEEMSDVTSVSVFWYAPPELVQDRVVLAEGEQELLREALQVRAAYALPFWDAVMLRCFRATCDISNLLDAAMLHRSHNEEIISRREVLNGTLGQLCSKEAEDMLAVTSRVYLSDGSLMHIPMVDFHCPKSEASLDVVRSVAQRLFPSGSLLLDSGQSYHAYGRNLVTPDGLMDFLATALLFAPIIDHAYCAHQILERRCALRMSRGGRKRQVPTVVATV